MALLPPQYVRFRSVRLPEGYHRLILCLPAKVYNYYLPVPGNRAPYPALCKPPMLLNTHTHYSNTYYTVFWFLLLILGLGLFWFGLLVRHTTCIYRLLFPHTALYTTRSYFQLSLLTVSSAGCACYRVGSYRFGSCELPAARSARTVILGFTTDVP